MFEQIYAMRLSLLLWSSFRLFSWPLLVVVFVTRPTKKNWRAPQSETAVFGGDREKGNLWEKTRIKKKYCIMGLIEKKLIKNTSDYVIVFIFYP